MKRRRKVNKKKVILFIFIIIILVIGSIFIVSKLFDKEVVPSGNSVDNTKEDNYSIKLLMVGDNLINDKIYNTMKTNDTYDFKPIYTYIKEINKDYDLAYYNQETILGGSSIGVSSYPAFNSPYEVGDATIDAGFNLVSLATNHTLDRGEQAIINSRDYWNSKDNVLAVGSYSSNEEKDEIHILKKNNITYTMLNYTYGTNGIKVPNNKEYLVNVWPCTGNDPSTDTKYQEYKKTVKEDIEKVRDKVDLLIVAIHWGIEYKYTPNEYQKDMASYLASLGVNIIIGTHPHVVEPITYIDNTLVIYSLGNFVSAQDTVEDYNTRVGLLSTITINKDSNNNISLSDLNNELIFTTDSSNSYKVIPFSNPDIKTYLNDYERVYNKYSSIVKSIDDTIKINSLSS